MSEFRSSVTSDGLDNLTHSDLFKMQLRELLQNITPRYEIEYIDAESAIKKLRETIENIPERESVVVSRVVNVNLLPLS